MSRDERSIGRARQQREPYGPYLPKQRQPPEPLVLITQKGDDFYRIARDYFLEPRQLRRVNLHLCDPQDLKGGEALVIPLAEADMREMQSFLVKHAINDAEPKRRFGRLVPASRVDRRLLMRCSPGESSGAMRISAAGLNLIKEFEGFKPKLYNDLAGHCTIGYGDLLHKGNCTPADHAKYPNGVTEAEATEMMRKKLVGFEAAVNKLVTVPLNQNQYDALVVFTYNFNEVIFAESGVLRELNNGNYDAVPGEMAQYNKAGRPKQVIPGLVRRRKLEGELFSRNP